MGVAVVPILVTLITGETIMSNTQTETVDMAFLIDRTEEVGEVVAVMPACAATVGRPNHCTCYVRNGQHGACDVAAMVNYYDQATPAEYADLQAELEGIGYNVLVIPKDCIDSNDYEGFRRRELGL